VRRFDTVGLIPRPNARCPVCRSLERHRLIWLYLRDGLGIRDGRRPMRLLHLAPEPALERKLSSLRHIQYITSDLRPKGVRVCSDVTRLPFGDDSFDAVLCSHVLEHISDDRTAMRELGRILASDGWVLLQVPVRGEVTVEDSNVSSPEERERLFGQKDHVRYYGMDFADRLRECGFSVTVDQFAERFPEKQRLRLGIRDEPLFVCRV
jgi:SAM-dependent methyltransferase